MMVTSIHVQLVYVDSREDKKLLCHGIKIIVFIWWIVTVTI